MAGAPSGSIHFFANATSQNFSKPLFFRLNSFLQ